MSAVENDLRAPRVRPMGSSDVWTVAAIEAEAYQYPWSPGIFRDCLSAGYHALVLEIPPSGVQGYAVLSTGAGEAHLLNLCVRPALHRTGLGRVLLDAALRQATVRGAREIFLEVRPSNSAAVGLYEGSGFRQIGRRKRYYRAKDGREDALVFARDL